MSKTNGKSLRFAALIRVSTEKQERQGESLRTQSTQIERAVKSLGGVVATRYAGQEHATAGWERQQLDKLLEDAAKARRPFDAVMVADASRWSRDNVRSETGLEHLRDKGVRFFVLTTEYDLFNAEARLFLALTATIGAYHARSQKQKSLLNRIERAKRGIPTGGKVPFGRRFDKATGKWSIDPNAQALAYDVGERYLAGEALPKLAREYGINHSNLCKILRERCGSDWKIRFKAADLNIDETVTIRVPPLLPEKMIKAIRPRLQANRTYLHGSPKYDYLLSGRVFCAECGYAMFGQTNHGLISYYRHAHTERARTCSLSPRPWVRADAIESAVVRQLFDLFGNPAAIERAVKSAVPDGDKLLKRKRRLEADIAKVGQARDRILELVIKEAITTHQAQKKLDEVKAREDALLRELDKVNAVLGSSFDLDQLKDLTIEVHRIHRDIVIEDKYGNRYAGGNDVQCFLMMDTADRQKLVDSAFGEPLDDGTPAGIYIKPAGGDFHGPKRFTYELKGRLLGSVKRRALS